MKKVFPWFRTIIMNNTIRLIKSKLFMTSDDDIPLPFVTTEKT